MISARSKRSQPHAPQFERSALELKTDFSCRGHGVRNFVLHDAVDRDLDSPIATDDVAGVPFSDRLFAGVVGPAPLRRFRFGPSANFSLTPPPPPSTTPRPPRYP